MSRRLCIWFFRNPPLNAYPQKHIFLHRQQLRQISLDTRLWGFRQNKSRVLPRLLNKSCSRSYCHQDTKMLWKHKALRKYMEDLNKEYRALERSLQDVSEHEGERRALHRRHAELVPLAAVYQEIQEAEQAIEELESMCESLNKQDEKQLQELISEERQIIDKKINTLYSKLLEQLVPEEKHDGSDVILEVTSGRTTGGGLHHAAARISGDSVYKHLKYEGGIHRVQRIPEVGLSSRMQRIHTGTMSVIVLPQPDEIDVKVDAKDLRIDTFRSKGAGGQHVNTTDSAVRLVHVPTGLVVECQQERSQLRNKEIALRVLRARLYQQIVEKDKCQQQSSRKLQVGTRAQSERIRTYNFTQDRVTDHRIAFEVRDIKEFLRGEKCLDQLIQRLLQSADEEAIAEFLDESLKSVK
ncbi:peptide chain release factor 1, mitochondrial isoform X2 [Chionomys nivalis]|uniref:peptide chain release factor 1, mitochondrial isoform X2 n=1 Tax=Chionomys nivalis TaxID=269649 RepID=UPI00259946D8|nr:peptide chain release factor 1, mitochondrial isoform X2 [Chionomys nivalis]